MRQRHHSSARSVSPDEHGGRLNSRDLRLFGRPSDCNFWGRASAHCGRLRNFLPHAAVRVLLRLLVQGSRMTMLGDDLGLVDPEVYEFLSREIQILLNNAKTFTPFKVEIEYNNFLSVRCEADPPVDGTVRIHTPRQLITRLALISALFYKTRQAQGKNVLNLFQQTADIQDVDIDFRDDAARREYIDRHRREISNMPPQYGQLVGSFNVDIEKNGLDWW